MPVSLLYTSPNKTGWTFFCFSLILACLLLHYEHSCVHWCIYISLKTVDRTWHSVYINNNFEPAFVKKHHKILCSPGKFKWWSLTKFFFYTWKYKKAVFYEEFAIFAGCSVLEPFKQWFETDTMSYFKWLVFKLYVLLT